MFSRSLPQLFRATLALRTISDEYIPRAFPVKSTTGLAGVAVEPLWKPKLLAAAAELEAFLKTSDIPSETTYYNNAAHTTVVGGCLFSSCPPKGKQCWGQKTVYTEVVSEACFY